MNPVEQTVSVTFTVNGTLQVLDTPPRRLLSDALRHDLRFTGTHVGCEHGVCGACTVLVDGAPTRSCLVFAVSLEGARITTVEGCCAADGGMGPVQQAFQDTHALQCGFCTPGILMAADDLLAREPPPTRAEITEMLSGQLCRCTGYAPIVAAIAEVAGAMPARGGL